MKRRNLTPNPALGGYLLGVVETHGIPQKALALRSGIHQSTLSRIFNGVTAPTEIQLIQMGRALGEITTETKQKPRRANGEA